MLLSHIDEINEGDNVIIGLGDSFTQGVGAYSLDTWKNIPENPSVYNISGNYFIDEQAKNNWVRQLRDNFLPDYKVINLGVNGSGNRSTIREMYLASIPKNLGNVIAILMSTALERYDFLKKYTDNTMGQNRHYKWQTIFPVIADRGSISRLEKEYFEQIWCNQSDILEFLFNISDAQNFCKSRGYKFLFASAFDPHINRNSFIKELDTNSKYIDIINWENFIKINNRNSFMDMIYQLDHDNCKFMYQIHSEYSSLKMPTTYITPCCHWTIDGNFKVAEYLANELQNRKLI